MKWLEISKAQIPNPKEAFPVDVTDYNLESKGKIPGIWNLAFSISLSLLLLVSCSTAHKMQQPENSISTILSRYPQFFDTILKNKEQYRVQIIYTQIDRRRSGKPVFTDYHFDVDANEYFYPASTIKLPVALLSLQRINELNIPGLDKYTMMITEADQEGQSIVYNDPTTPDGRPTVAHYIKKILLVSDNDASNRLYEFLGQEYVNNKLHSMGYDSVQIIHRLNIFLTEEQNRQTNPVNFYDTSSQVIYRKPGMRSNLAYAERNTKMGKGFMRAGQLVNEPFDFSKRNRLPLPDLHAMLRSVVFPKSVARKQRFELTEDDRKFFLKHMFMRPGESTFPSYDSNYHDNYAKFLFYGAENTAADPAIRSFNKVGDAYGFLVDAAYIVDYKNQVEFLLSAVIHCNSDGVYNDDKYDYKTIGFPFMKNLGRVIYEHELNRERKFKPDLSGFVFN